MILFMVLLTAATLFHYNGGSNEHEDVPPNVAPSLPPSESLSLSSSESFRLSSIETPSIHNSVSPSLPSKINLQVITWNVNRKQAPQKEILKRLVDFTKDPDMIVIGLQEVAVSDRPRIHHSWRRSLINVIVRRGYVLVKRTTMVTVMNMVYVKAIYKELVSSDRQQRVPTGKLKLGNKGGVSIRVHLGGISFSFLSAHLPPHDGKEKKREEAVSKIYEEINRTVYPVRYKFLLGDLNFRLTNVEIENVREELNNSNYEALLQYDEFLRSDEDMLKDMKEQKIEFRPTYKFNEDGVSYNDKRRPAWTDRVLYKETFGDSISPTTATRQDSIIPVSYESLEEFKMSDHKPVRACFELNIKPDTSSHSHEEISK